MSLCIASAGGMMALLAGSFSLSWTHSVEKTLWVEHWQVVGNRLALVSASVEGSGAGIDLPEDAVWKDGRWTYRPSLSPIKELNLAASATTPSGWTLCAGNRCYDLGTAPETAIRIWSAPICKEL